MPSVSRVPFPDPPAPVTIAEPASPLAELGFLSCSSLTLPLHLLVKLCATSLLLLLPLLPLLHLLLPRRSRLRIARPRRLPHAPTAVHRRLDCGSKASAHGKGKEEHSLSLLLHVRFGRNGHERTETDFSLFDSRFRPSKPYFTHALKWSVLQYSLLRALTRRPNPSSAR